MLTKPQTVTPRSSDQASLDHLMSFVQLARNKEAREKYNGTSPETRQKLKHLLGRELDVVQIALRLGRAVREAEEFILFRGWAEFLQPTRFKEAKRRARAERQKLMAGPEQMAVLGEAMNWGRKVLRNDNLAGRGGYQKDMINDMLEEEAKCLFVHCLRNWEPDGDGRASFRTFFWRLWKLKLLNVKQKVCDLFHLADLMGEEKETEIQAA